MSLSRGFLTHLQKQLHTDITNVNPVGGGSINRVYCLHSSKAKYLIKVNDKHAYPGMFAAEKIGLDTIRRTQTVHVPEVILQDDFGEESFLILEWIDNKRPTTKGTALLGEQLAQMHKFNADSFGFVADNYMGSLPQSNRSHQIWAEFYIEERLKPMVDISISKSLINKNIINKLNQLYDCLSALFEEEKPSLIHGDLWGGNYLVGVDDQPYLIDPAICYGNREFDTAMTTLFGGFSNEFYEAYQHHFPLNPGWQQRLDLWNLYPLFVHLNLFGLGYLGQVEDILKRYV